MTRIFNLTKNNFATLLPIFPKSREHSVEITEFFCHSDFTWKQFWLIWECQKMSFLNVSEAFNFDFLAISHLWKVSRIPKYSKFRFAEMAKMAVFECRLWICQKWFRVKAEWQRNSAFSVLCNFPEIARRGKDTHLWKFQDFSAIQTFREINFGNCKRSKTAVFTNLGDLNFVI